MDLSTMYMGLHLRSPLVPSACQPLTDEISKIRRMEDHGAGAVVLYSIFEEQLRNESLEMNYHLDAHSESFAEATSFFPEAPNYVLGPEEYLDHIRKAKEAVGIPIIASLNASSLGGWTSFAEKMQAAGADALELNIYRVPVDAALSSESIENTYCEIVRAVRKKVKIPVAVKLSPYFTNMCAMAKRLDDAGANALVLFNRFYQPDIDLETLEIRPNVLLSSPVSLRLPLRWTAILSPMIKADIAATSGIHRPEDVIKVLMAGASVSMLCSSLLRYGIQHLRTLEHGIVEWMEKHEYDSVATMQGSMSQCKVENPEGYERAQYLRTIHSFEPGKTQGTGQVPYGG